MTDRLTPEERAVVKRLRHEIGVVDANRALAIIDRLCAEPHLPEPAEIAAARRRWTEGTEECLVCGESLGASRDRAMLLAAYDAQAREIATLTDANIAAERHAVEQAHELVHLKLSDFEDEYWKAAEERDALRAMEARLADDALAERIAGTRLDSAIYWRPAIDAYRRAVRKE
jgi:hypothetical protein